ncbi:MAG TPA: proton-conducting transporter membrane subunit, partial [Thermomicrobiales bacterium]|nr:proton-conducting transporter membrane subunit [Thermomicrobiales bacterium]
MDFPLLSAIAFLPVIGSLLIFVLPNRTRETARTIALAVTILSFVLSMYMLFAFDHNDQFQFTEHATWLTGLGASYHLGVDGLGVLLVALTTLIGIIAVIWSWNTIKVRAPEYYMTLLLLQTGMLGVFMALDLFVFYIFWEIMLIPMALLIGVWGSQNRVYAAIKFFLFTLAGSLLTFLGLLTLVLWDYQHNGEHTLRFSIPALTQGLAAHPLPPGWQTVVFLALFAGFAIKVPLFPLHTWLPLAHVQ